MSRLESDTFADRVGVVSRGSASARPRAIGLWLAALAGGGVSVLAFAPFKIFPLAILCPALLFWLADGMPPRGAASLGALYGIGAFGFGMYWLNIALNGIGGAPLPLALLIQILLVLTMAVFYALVLALAARIAPTGGAARYLLWLPALWVIFEWLRSWVFSGFPWFSLGYSQIQTPLVGYAPIFGVFGLSWAVTLSAGLALMLARRPRRWPIWLAGALAIWGGGAALNTIAWTHPLGKPQTATLVQGDIPQGRKWSLRAVSHAIRRYAALTRGHWHSNLIVWPETAIPDYESDLRPALDRLGRRLAAHDSTLITGILRADRKTGAIYNAAVAIGAGRGHYAKRHLVPLSEYFPVPAFIRRWMARSGLPHSDFTAGKQNQPLLYADGYALGLSICYEAIFGALIASDLPAAKVLVNVSDDAWFGRSIGPDQHFQISRMRAAETGRYLLRADNSAVTAVVGPRGAVKSRLTGLAPGALHATFQPMAGATPFVHWKNWGIVALLGLTIAAFAGVTSYRRRRRRKVAG